MEYIYKFTNADGIYIGKLKPSSNTIDPITYHLEGSYPWSSIHHAAWEPLWKADLIKHGFAKSKYVKKCEVASADEVVNNIKVSMKDWDNSFKNKSFWNTLSRFWYKTGQQHEYEVAEALCILLATKNHSVLNTQVDFLSRVSNGARLTSENALQLLSLKELEDKTIRANELKPEFYLTFSGKKILDNVDQSLWSLVFDHFKQQGINVKKKILLTGGFGKQIISELSLQITNHTIPGLIKQLEHYRKQLDNMKYARGKQPVIKNINQTIRELKSIEKDNISNKTYKEIFNLVFNNIQTIKDDATKITISLGAEAEILADCLLDWYRNTDINTIFKNTEEKQLANYETIYWKELLKHYYNSFSNAMLTNNPIHTNGRDRTWALTLLERTLSDVPVRRDIENINPSRFSHIFISVWFKQRHEDGWVRFSNNDKTGWVQQYRLNLNEKDPKKFPLWIYDAHSFEEYIQYANNLNCGDKSNNDMAIQAIVDWIFN